MRSRLIFPLLLTLAVFLSMVGFTGCTGGGDEISQVTISTLTVVPQQTGPDQPVTIGANVMNTGKSAADYTAELKINEAVIETRQISLAAGETRTISFQYIPHDPGSYRVDINGQTAGFEVARPAAFTLESLTVVPAEPVADDNLTAGFKLRNNGDLSGEYKAVLMVDGVEVQTTGLTLEGGAAQTVDLDFIIEQAGFHSVEIGGLKHEIRVLKPAEFKSVDVYLAASSVLPGEAQKIQAEIQNEGEVKETRDVTLMINGSEYTKQSVTLEAGAKTMITFTYTTETSGLYTAKVLDCAESFNVISLSKYTHQAFFYTISYPPDFQINEGEPGFIHFTKRAVGDLSVHSGRIASTATAQEIYDRAATKNQEYYTDWQVVNKTEIKQVDRVSGYRYESSCTIDGVKYTGRGVITITTGLAFGVDFMVNETLWEQYRTLVDQTIRSLTPAPAFSGHYSSSELGLAFDMPGEWIAVETDLSSVPVILSSSAEEESVEGYIITTVVTSGTTAKEFFDKTLEPAVKNGWQKGVGSDFTFADGSVGYVCPVSGILDTRKTYIYRIFSLVKDGRGYLMYFYASDIAINPETKNLTGIAYSLAVARPGGISGIDRKDSVIFPQGELTSFDPALTESGPGDVIGAVFSGLVRFSTELQIVPDLAESWKVSEDGRTYTFSIRTNARFHDGRPVTAADVKYSWERACDPATGSPKAASFLEDIVGVREKLAGTAGPIKGLAVIDEHTLAVTIDAAKPYFLAELAQPVAFIVDQNDMQKGARWYEQPNGTGAFKVKSWEKDKKLVLERYDDFYLGPAKVKNLVFLLNTTNPMELYANGEIDVVPLSVQVKDQVLDPEFAFAKEMISGSVYSSDYIGFNVSQEPFNDSKVRQAVALATDVSKLIEIELKGEVTPAAGYIPPGIPGYNKDLVLSTFNLVKAKQLIAESSYGSAERVPQITFYSLYAVSSIDQAVIGMWQNLGLKVKTQVISNLDDYLARLKNREIMVWISGWRADYIDPQNFLDVLFRSDSPGNYFGYNNPAVDAALAKAAIEPNPDIRMKMYQDIERMILTDLPGLPLWCQSNTYALVKPYLKGYALYPMSINLWMDLSVGAR